MTDINSIFNEIWYPVINDLIGGWAVSTANVRVSVNHEAVVADFMDYLVAQHIAALHNTELERGTI